MVANPFPPATSNQDRRLNPCRALLLHSRMLGKDRRHVKIFTLPRYPTDKALCPARGRYPHAASAQARLQASNVCEHLRDRRPRRRDKSRSPSSASEPALRRPTPGPGAARLRRRAASSYTEAGSSRSPEASPGRAGREALRRAAAPAPGRAQVPPAGRDPFLRPAPGGAEGPRPPATARPTRGRDGPCPQGWARAPRRDPAPAHRGEERPPLGHAGARPPLPAAPANRDDPSAEHRGAREGRGRQPSPLSPGPARPRYLAARRRRHVAYECL